MAIRLLPLADGGMLAVGSTHSAASSHGSVFVARLDRTGAWVGGVGSGGYVVLPSEGTSLALSPIAITQASSGAVCVPLIAATPRVMPP